MNAHTRAEALRLVDQIRRDVAWLCGDPGEHAAANCDKLRALLSASDDGWRAMESAPRDGRTVVLCRETSFLGFWDANQKAWCDHRQFFRDPTHWMPLPPPPNGETK